MQNQVDTLFASLPQVEQKRLLELSPVARLSALRTMIKAPQTAQPTQTSQINLEPGKRALLESYAQTLPDVDQMELGQLSEDKRLTRLYELKDRFDRLGY
ncbi:hypothetical protein NG799_29075 [Laspinema sp. D1]|uniref:Uncharacterized protein n=1 Tax=Laspinema palackyanum D2a TaxID=2953684 RepID=A0ABT2N3T7_9CYAN|nr:hypothetical protein [Laspinema sp. D2a]